ncbi:MAG: glycosyltransferase family 39 protein [Anaerolineaceae bacterium]|nr:glycosyltransferase family 39 protein [Anaerolineaceae bacterium]
MTPPVWRWLAPLLVLLAATALRTHAIGVQSLWSDEGNSVVQAGRQLTDIALHAARDIHPPGYYQALHVWTRLTGSSEFALRLFSALASVLGVACVLAAGRVLYGFTAGLAAALLLALNGFSIWYAQETRMYALLALWGAAAALALTALLLRPGRARILALGLVNAAGLWTHYAWPFVMLAQGGVAALWLAGESLRHRGTRRRLVALLAAAGIALLLFLPWLATALERVSAWPATGVALSGGMALQRLYPLLAVGPSFAGLTAEWQAVAAGSALLLILAGSAPTRRALWRSGLPLVWTLSPCAAFLALGLYREPNLKFLLPAQAGFALWAGRGFAWMWSCPAPLLRALALAAGALLVTGMALSLGPLGHDTAWHRADYRALVADISVGLGNEDLIVLNAPNQVEVFHYYYRGDAEVLPMPPGTGPVDEASLQRLQGGVAQARRVYALFWGESERDPQGIVERALVAGAHVADSRWYGDVRLVTYSVPRSLGIVETPDARFGDQVVLLRHSRNAGRLAAGEDVQLQLDWRADAALALRYKVFLQLLDAEGQLVAQHDSEPGGGLAPTDAWAPGETVVDRRALMLPEGLAVGRYTLIVGLYTENDPAQRLPLGDADHLVVGTLEITGEKG